ncbi:DUF5011 domain-containing protein [uncultured Aquimarina sp.]|uniref:DUF5011 domain-containing protein n=1 Tax=uncultured Aquimarina sp. TaxID=575652 RepID=UPI002635E0CA|nr:DUF5011 domain-containing protein [uncultured Aquimarina sp.]
MKNFYQYIVSGIVLLFIGIACTKEITDDLVVFFKVEFSETTIETFVDTKKESQFTITGVTDINVGDYQIKYNVTEGAGSYFLNTVAIAENEFVDLPEGPEYTIEYQGTVVGANKVTLTIRDQSNREEEFILTYNVNDTDFTFDVVPFPEAITYVNGEIDLNLNIEEVSSATYDVQYVFGTPDADVLGTGSVIVDGAVLDPETTVEIPIGDSTWKFGGLTVGAVEITFTATSSFGISKSKIIRIEVGETPDFTFAATLDSDVIFTTNSGAVINFTITEIAGTSSYVMNYRTSNAGNVVYNGETYQAGDNIPIQAGSSIGTYIGTAEGAHNLDFRVDNANIITVSKEASLLLNFRNPDGTAPVIELIGDSEVTINVGDTFSDPGATATDDIDGDISANITVSGVVDTNTPGAYTLVYSIEDSSGNTSSTERIVNVVDNIPPVITIIGDNPFLVREGDAFSDPGATATDNIDGNISSQIAVTGSVNVNVVGDYMLTYTVSDVAGNEVSEIRTVNVISDNPPMITLLGDNPLEISFGEAFDDPGATAVDDIDGDISSQIETSGTVDVNTLGEYTIIYSVTDSSGNNTEAVRTVNVVDSTNPVITLEGANPFLVNVGNIFNDPGANASDNVDGNLTSGITVSGTVDVNTPGDYVLTYSVEDSSGNIATITRTVRVIDNIAPVITLIGAPSFTIPLGSSYTDPGATALDNIDGDLTSQIVTTGNVDLNTAGTYIIRYNVQDAAGNNAIEVTRTIIVEAVVSFNRVTGVLNAPAGATVEISMTSGGTGSGNATMQARDTNNLNLGIGITCWGLTGGEQCLDSDGDGNDETSGFTFIMPANGIANITGSHNPDGTSVNSGTGFSIQVSGETFNGNMGAGNGIPQ